MNAEYDKGYQSGYDAGYKRAMLDYGLEDDKPCEDAVSLDGVINTIEWYRMNPQHFTEDNLIEDIKGLPPVAPKQKTGHWIAGQTMGDGFTCSECNTHYRMYPMIYRFCPSCGTKMEGENK